MEIESVVKSLRLGPAVDPANLVLLPDSGEADIGDVLIRPACVSEVLLVSFATESGVVLGGVKIGVEAPEKGLSNNLERPVFKSTLDLHEALRRT